MVLFIKTDRREDRISVLPPNPCSNEWSDDTSENSVQQVQS